MEIVKNDLTKLYAVVTDKSEKGIMGLIVDPEGPADSALIRVNAFDEESIKIIFGLLPPDEAAHPDDLAYLAEVKGMLNKNFPDGYEVEWVGNWRNDPRTVKICGWLDGAKIEEDDYFDYMLPEKIIKINLDMAKQHGYTPNKDFWKGDKSKDFYLGMAAGARIMTSLVGSSKNQKELLERLNKISLDSMILSDQKVKLNLF